MAMTDKTGKVVWRADELPFGEEYQTQETPERNDRRFLGKQLDKETGLICMGKRYLDSRTGRFTQPDPVGLVDPATGKVNQEMLLNPQRLNRYVYALNNPYKYVDPDGRAARDFEHLRNPWRDMTEGGGPRSGGGYTGPKVRFRDFFKSSQSKSPDFIVSPKGTAYPVPKGAQGPKPVFNQQGRQTGTAFTGGKGGKNNQVNIIRIMDSTPARGRSPGYPKGYIKYENNRSQGVNPYSGKTVPNSKSHYPID